jgi:hypothetical protein
MLVEFTRATPPVAPSEFGEDDGLQNPQAQVSHPIAINPTTISAVFESANDPNVTIVRLADGRGFMVQGNYAQVMETLRANGGVTPAN